MIQIQRVEQEYGGALGPRRQILEARSPRGGPWGKLPSEPRYLPCVVRGGLSAGPRTIAFMGYAECRSRAERREG
jgi:hypothetical protein